LTSVAPPVLLVIGVGIPRADGSGCVITRSVETAPGSEPQVAVTSEPGTYCVKVAATSFLSEPTTFSATVKHP
jgi:hypothetical protein